MQVGRNFLQICLLQVIRMVWRLGSIRYLFIGTFYIFNPNYNIFRYINDLLIVNLSYNFNFPKKYPAELELIKSNRYII